MDAQCPAHRRSLLRPARAKGRRHHRLGPGSEGAPEGRGRLSGVWGIQQGQVGAGEGAGATSHPLSWVLGLRPCGQESEVGQPPRRASPPRGALHPPAPLPSRCSDSPGGAPPRPWEGTSWGTRGSGHSPGAPLPSRERLVTPSGQCARCSVLIPDHLPWICPPPPPGPPPKQGHPCPGPPPTHILTVPVSCAGSSPGLPPTRSLSHPLSGLIPPTQRDKATWGPRGCP